jgi:hypothetical protein
MYPRKGPKHKEQSPFSWVDHCARLSEVEFKKRYRLTQAAFNELLEGAAMNEAAVASGWKKMKGSAEGRAKEWSTRRLPGPPEWRMGDGGPIDVEVQGRFH